MAKKLTYQQYKQMIEDQATAMLDTLAYVATGNLDVEIEIPEGIEVLTDLAIGFSYLVDDVRELFAEQEKTKAELEERVAMRTRALELALEDVQAMQSRYLQQEWTKYADDFEPDSLANDDAPMETLSEKWLSIMSQAVEQNKTVIDTNGHHNLVVPLSYSNELIGVLGFDGAETAQWGAEDLAAVEAIAEQVGLALENQRLFDQTQAALAETEQQVQSLALLNEMNTQLGVAESQKEIFDVIAHQVAHIIHSDRASIALLNPAGDMLEILALQGERGAIPTGTRLPLNGTAVGAAVMQKELIRVPDTVQSNWVDSQELGKQGLLSSLCTPLMVGGQVIGTLNIGSSQLNKYTIRDENLLLQIASMAASTIENRRLLDQTKQALTQTETLYDSSERMVRAETINDVLLALVESTFIKQFDRANIAFFDQVWTETIPKEFIIAAVWERSGESSRAPAGTRYLMEQLSFFFLLNRDTVTFVYDLVTDKRLDENSRTILVDQLGMRSLVIFPLIVGEQWIGFLTIQASVPTELNEDQLRQINSLVGQAATVVQNQRLFEQTQATLTETRILYEVTRILTRAATLEGGLTNMLTILSRNNIPVPVVGISLQIIDVDEASQPDWGELVADWRFDGTKSPIPTGTRFLLKDMTFTNVWSQDPSTPIFIDNVEVDERLDEESRALFLRGQIRAAVVMPLFVSGRWVGLLNLNWRRPRLFTEQERRIYQTLTVQMATFVHGQRLFEQTQQRAVELEESATFLNTIIDNIPSGLFVKDAKDLRFIQWNKANEAITGLSKEDVLGKNDYDFFPKEEADFFVQADRQVLNGRELLDIPEEEIHTADKRLRILHTKKVPILAADGTPRYMLGISEDISKQKEARAERERLLAEVQRLATLVENHADFIGTGTMEGQALYVNPAGLRMMGLPPDYDVTKIDARHFYPPEDAAKLIQEGIPTALESGSWTAEANLRRVDGTTIPVEETVGINYDAAGKPYSFTITMRDIAKRKEAEAERENLLAEVEAAYRQYVEREWSQFLSEQHQGVMHIEHQQGTLPIIGDLSTVSGGNGDETQSPLQDIRRGLNKGQISKVETAISLRGQTIGTLKLEDMDPNRIWTEEETALIEAVSEQLAQTVENLRLFGDTQQRAAREELTREIADKMRALPDVESIIQVGVQELAKVLGGSHTVVELNLETDDVQ